MASESSQATTTSLHEIPATLVGTWYNELGSTMEIDSTSPAAGQLTGRYHTGVGNAKDKQFDLVGLYDISEDSTQRTLGW